VIADTEFEAVADEALDIESLDEAPAPEPSEVVPSQPTVPYVPEHLLSETTAAVVVLCVLSVLTIVWPIPLGLRANPDAVLAAATPAWYLLFLHELVRFAGPVAGTLAPAVLLVLLGTWPFLDKNPYRDPRRRVLALVLGTATVCLILALTYSGWAR